METNNLKNIRNFKFLKRSFEFVRFSLPAYKQVQQVTISTSPALARIFFYPDKTEPTAKAAGFF
jgi:hypothetical protein